MPALPMHAALYDGGTSAIVRGPPRAFKPLAGNATTGARSKTFAVKVCDGAIWLVGMHVSGSREQGDASPSPHDRSRHAGRRRRRPSHDHLRRRARLLDAWNGTA